MFRVKNVYIVKQVIINFGSVVGQVAADVLLIIIPMI